MSAVPLRSAELATAAPLASRSARHGGIDTLRMAAVVGVVFYHAGLLASLPALTGMHALIITSVVFASASGSHATAGRVISKRASRLLLPWLFFAVLHLLFAARLHQVRPWMFLIGGSVHLWFVPFIFVVTCSVALFCRTRPLPRSWIVTVAWATLAVLAMHAEVRLTPHIADMIPLGQCLDGITAVAAAMALLSLPREGRAAPLFLATALLAIGAAVWLPWRSDDLMTLPPAPLGLLLFLAVAMLPPVGNGLTDFLGRVSFGLYLMHPLVLHVLEGLYAGLSHAPRDALPAVVIAECAAATVVLCIGLIAVLDRTALRRLVI